MEDSGGMIDLRSDTATRPSAEMRAFMAAAPVGDEQLREDPSVNRLQEMVATLTGKEAALYLPSGTMCNEIALSVHCRRGDAVILDQWAHPCFSEAGGPAVLANVMLTKVAGTRGIFTADEIAPLIGTDELHGSRTSLISVENTTNFGGGAVWPLETLAGLRALADEHELPIHMDGARLMNAVVASGQPASAFAQYADSVWIDLSKGLGAPVGAVLAGSAEFIGRARRFKHLYGGAMRQAGIIAAGGIYALEHNVERLADDHASAKLLEAGIREIPGITQVNGPVETNILFFTVDGLGMTPAEFTARLLEHGVRLSGSGKLLRAVTHLDVSQADCEAAVAAMRAVAAARAAVA
jgi:threonine aldolase